jgi:flavodoxin
MNKIIVYKSKTGFTKKYAEWIAKELDSDIIEQKFFNKNYLKKYDLIIYGGSLHAIGIFGLKKILKLLKNKQDKKIIVFAVGASPLKKKVLEEIKQHNFKNKTIPLFYLRGGFNFKKLDLFNKIIMYLFIKNLESKKDKTKDEIGLIKAYKKPVDFTDKKNIKEIIKFIKK